MGVWTSVIDLLDVVPIVSGGAGRLAEVRDGSTPPGGNLRSAPPLQRSAALARERLRQAERAFGTDDVRVVPALTLLAGVHLNQAENAPVPALLERARALLDATRHDC